MPLSPQQLLAQLEGLGITTRTVEHPALFTVSQSRELRGELPGGHTKNLFLKDKKGRFFLVSCREDANVDLKRLHERLGASGRLSFGNAEQLMDKLGVEPGAVTLFGTVNDKDNQVTVAIDKALLAYDTINAHPLTNTMTTALSRDDLMRFLEMTGHVPLVIDVEAQDVPK
ncbi:MAG: prolyl-tRNA synthetase associated domain-containing protein [Hyphomicrobiales bacterium]|nr:prolyl-tRNA synthetase associated domain-containing protein [Hyphomicrobiales bacterium]